VVGSARAYLWEVSFGVADEQTRLSTATVADDDELLGEDGRLGEGGANGIVARRSRHVAVDGAVADPFVRRAARGFAEGLSMRQRVYGADRGSRGGFATQIVVVGVAVDGAGARHGHDGVGHVVNDGIGVYGTEVDCL
jgi:hypothetical protein